MEATTPAALVEPKKQPQGVAAKAKRLKGLRENPDFVEAVQEERLVAQLWEESSDRAYVFAHKAIKELREEVRLREDTGELKNKYIDQLEGNKVYLSMRSRGTRGLLTPSLRRPRR
jgi:hypothetical protein